MSISVVIPTYNRGEKVKATIDSALSQDLSSEEVEIIVVDDGSTDDTFAILERLYGKNSRVRLFSTSNGGIAQARNFGLEQARGEFIAYLDHDDLWLPQKLRLQLAAMQKSEKIGVVYCLWEHFDERGTIPSEDTRVWEPQLDFDNPHVLEKLLTGNFIISMSVPLLRISALRFIGGFDPKAVPCDDLDVWIRLSENYGFIGIQEKLVWYRHHENQQSHFSGKMFIADRYTRWKNRRLNFKHPHTLLALHRPNSLLVSQPVYGAVKKAIFAQQWAYAWKLSLVCLFRRPLVIFTSQWIYLMKKLIQRDSRHF